jgi:hypothetical protein
MRKFYAYVWRSSASRQIVLIILAVMAALMAMAPLELQRHIIAPDAQHRIVRDTSSVAAELIEAVDFPGFVADLIDSVFQAIVDSSIQQMKAYGELIAAVAESLNEIRVRNVTETEARDRLAERFPDLFTAPMDPCELPKLPKTRYPLIAWMLAVGITRIVVTKAGVSLLSGVGARPPPDGVG